MASSKEIRAGRSFVEIYLKDKLPAGLKRAANRLRAFGTTIAKIGLVTKGLGLSVLGSLGAAAKVFDSMGSSLFDASKRTGASVEALSELKHAAEQSGAGLEAVEAGFKGVAKLFYAASKGSSEAVETLTDLGLTFADLEALTPDERFKLIADRLSKIEDPSIRAALALKAFTRGGIALLPMLEEGAEGFAKFQQRIKELGLTMSGEDAAAADKFGDILGDLWAQAKMVTFHVGAGVAKALQPWLEGVTKITAGVIGWLKENRGLVVTVGAVATGVVALGGAVLTLGVSMQVAAIAMKGVAIGISLLASPVALVSAALIGGAAAWFFLSDSGRAAMSELKGTAQATFKGIADAMAAGDIAMAADILWTGLKLAWLQGTGALFETWTAFITDCTGGLFELEAAFKAVWTRLADFHTTIWKTIGDAMGAAMAKQRAELRRDAAAQAVIAAENERNRILQGPDTPENRGRANVLATRLNKGGDLNKEFAEAQRQLDDVVSGRAESSLDEQRKREAQAQEEELKKKLAAIEQERKAKLAGSKQIRDQGIAELEAEKAALLEKLKALQGKAAAGTGPRPALPDAAREGLDIAEGQTSARTGFNARALLSLQGGNAAERTAKAAEAVAKNTNRTNQLLEDNEGVFA